MAVVVARVDIADAVEFSVMENVEYANHDGVSLGGTFYKAETPEPAPVIVAVHGGGWQVGDRTVYKYWGPYLAEKGYSVFAIEYRLGEKTYPQSVQDVVAAVQYVRGRAGELNVDPDRIALLGDSSGGHLAALVALAGNEEPFKGAYPDDTYADVSPGVKAVATFYGVFDMAAQWEHDQIARPADQISEKYIGVPPMRDRQAYFEASPIAHAEIRDRNPSFLVVYGTEDDVVEPESQSLAFLTALKQARISALPVIVQGAPHLWIWDPIDEPESFTHFLAPRLMWFLKSKL
ncbi:alpha/beta hydrolase [Jiella avicenniae]|uniref:Alpha/beta hydrolase n=1 Tax=Jiella avicenniae TaxID=2907202 RepID=A0A9X1P2P9_9HYPH|nr:alpha/beta hydrolase [Jiella avicenniae]MCE7029423.1 alpha/beta hydrolase [Jiella avicenniae]